MRIDTGHMEAFRFSASGGWRRLAGAAVLCLLASSCMLANQTGERPPRESTAPLAWLSFPQYGGNPDHRESILAYYQWLGEADQQTREAETERYADSYRDGGVLEDGVRLALLLGFSRDSSSGELDRALNILNEVRTIGNPGEEKTSRQREHLIFAALWQDVLSQRLAMQQSLSEESARNERLREENEALQQQIEELKAIEQQLNQREQIQEPTLEQPTPNSGGG